MFWHLGAALYRFMGVEPQTAGTSHSEDDIRKMVSASEKGGSIDPVESRLIDNVFDFADRVAREVMVPRQQAGAPSLPGLLSLSHLSELIPSNQSGLTLRLYNLNVLETPASACNSANKLR